MVRLPSAPRWICSCWLIFYGCSPTEPPPPPVASVEVELSQAQLPFPEWRRLSLRWSPQSSLGAAENPLVFLQLLNEEGELERTFDHPFPEEWTVGSEVQYEVEIYQ